MGWNILYESINCVGFLVPFTNFRSLLGSHPKFLRGGGHRKAKIKKKGQITEIEGDYSW